MAEPDAITGTEPAYLIGLAHGGGQRHGTRTNIGWVNLTSEPLTLQLEVHNTDGAILGQHTVTVPPMAHHQENGLIGRLTKHEVVDVTAVLRAADPDAAYLAYASVVENGSGDPTLVMATRPVPMSDCCR